jgi:hypothetical protein
MENKGRKAMNTIEKIKLDGFDRSYTKDKIIHVKCSQCEAMVINGVACHETGCPNAKKNRKE